MFKNERDLTPNTRALPHRRSILLIYIGTFFFWMAMYLYSPVLSVYAESLGASLTMVGVIVAVYAIPQLVFRIPLGIWSDYLGRQKPLIIGGNAMIFLGSIGLVLSPSPAFLAVSRSLVGIGAASWVLYPIYLVTFNSEEKIGHVMGILIFITGTALAISTLLGGIISEARGEKFVFFLAAVFAVIAIASFVFAGEIKVPRNQSFSWQGYSQVARRPLLVVTTIMAVFLFFADFSTILGFIPIYATKIGASDTALGIVIMLNMAGSMIGSIASTPLVKRKSYLFVIILAALFLGLPLLAVPFTHDIALLGFLLLIRGIGYGLLMTQLMVLCIYNIPQQQRASAMGFFQAIYPIGMIIGPVISGALSNNYGLPVVFYLGGAFCLIIGVLAFLPVFPDRQNSTSPQGNA